MKFSDGGNQCCASHKRTEKVVNASDLKELLVN